LQFVSDVIAQSEVVHDRVSATITERYPPAVMNHPFPLISFDVQAEQSQLPEDRRAAFSANSAVELRNVHEHKNSTAVDESVKA
jgi:hypothetical protein